MDETSFVPQEIIINEQRCIYFLTEGQAEIYINLNNNSEQVLKTINVSFEYFFIYFKFL